MGSSTSVVQKKRREKELIKEQEVADSSVKLLAIDRDSFEKVLGSLKDVIDREANNRMIQTLPIIANLPQDRREAAVDMFSVETFSDGDVMSKCGDANPCFMLLKSGRALAWTHPRPEELEEKQHQKYEMYQERQTSSSNPPTPTALSNNMSFDSLQSFEMPSISSTDTNTEFGKEEILFRQKIEEATTEQKCEYNVRDKFLKYLGKNASELVSGDCIGADAVVRGSPMSCTLIAQGNVSCFILTRSDLLLLLEDDETIDKTSLETASRVRKIHSSPDEINVHEDNDEGEGSGIDWSHLEKLGKLGSGTFGVVYMMQDKNKNHYAMKVLNKRHIRELEQERRLISEKNILASTNSPFICKMFSTYQDTEAYYLLIELVTGGELKSLIHPSDKVKRNEQHAAAMSGEIAGIPYQPAKFYIAALSIPLNYLHRRSIVFRDLKPENVMIDSFGYPKLIDFGLATKLDETGKTYTLCGTPEFLAPEVILKKAYNQAVDWWALGVLLYEMIVGMSPFRGGLKNTSNQMAIFENIIENRITYSEKLEPKCADLIKSLLTRTPAFRMGCGRRGHNEFEEHDWFAGVVDWYALNKRFVTPPWIPPPLQVPS